MHFVPCTRTLRDLTNDTLELSPLPFISNDHSGGIVIFMHLRVGPQLDHLMLFRVKPAEYQEP